MIIDPTLFEVIRKLGHEGFPEVEVYHKMGRSRTLRWVPRVAVMSFRQEEGWATRAGDGRRSFFYASEGLPDADTPWPEADGRGLRLASARHVPQWTPPSSFDIPLIGENEARELFNGLARALDRELPGARLVMGDLEDGASESALVNSRGIESITRHRAASLFVEAVGPERGKRSVSIQLSGRAASRFDPGGLARRLADHLLIVERGRAPVRDRGEFLLGPPVAVSLLAALRRLWIGPGAVERVAALTDRRGRMGSPALTLIDDGRLADGVLEAPVDGEGQPTREVVIVDQGLYRQPILAWWETPSEPSKASGCCRRASWRDLPEPGPTHLYLMPDSKTRVGDLVRDLSRGYYLMATEGGARVDAKFERFAVPVCGFSIDSGRPTGSITGAWLTGTVSSFLNGILVAARDLTFLPRGSALIGSPTLLVKGLELRHRP